MTFTHHVFLWISLQMETRLWKKVSTEYFSIKVDLNDLLFGKKLYVLFKRENVDFKFQNHHLASRKNVAPFKSI